MKKQFKLVKNSAFGGYYLANSDFISDSYEMDGYYYTDVPVFTGTIDEVIHHFVKIKKENLIKGWNVEKLDNETLKYINHQAQSLIYEYRYLIGEAEEC